MLKTNWRTALALLVPILIGAVLLPVLLSQPVCLGEVACIWRTVLTVLAGAFGLSVLLVWLAARPRDAQVREITEAAQRLAAGDPKARIIPRAPGEFSDFIIAFNQTLDQHRSQLDSLSSEHSQFATVLEYMADGVLITDRNGVVRLINPAACRLLKTTSAEAIGRASSAVVRHHQLIELLRRSREESAEAVESIEVGPDLFLQAVVTPIQQMGATGYLVILQDLTQVRRLQTMRRDFISNLSHELRTPLASLRAVVETLQDGAIDDPPTAERFLSRAEREVDTLTQMVEELLELSQIESGQVRLRLESCAVMELIRVPVERLRTQIAGGELTLVLDLPDDLPDVLVDTKRMQQVVTNLLHNAIKFTPPGGCITFAARPADSGPNPTEIVMEIRDTGAGIAEQELGRIFERFYKSDRARTRGQGGTGLGLAIARHIVQAHGGRIWARSREGKGSSFYFTLPIG